MTMRALSILFLTGSIIAACTYTLPKVDDSSSCGDGIVDENELCDDGNTIDGDMCDSNCTPTACGNGIITNGEECDDGNFIDEDDCTGFCVIGICGDGIVKETEKCDDGNLNEGDKCDPNCTEPRCGNGFVAMNEICDDGNTVNGDACNATCTLAGTSSLFLGVPGTAGDTDGDQASALINGAQYMTIWGNTIYVANNQTVRAIDILMQRIDTIAGAANASGYTDSSNGLDARFMDLRGITTDGTTIWVSDVGNRLIRAIDAGGSHAVTTAAGIPDSTSTSVTIFDAAANQARFDSPRGLTYLNGVVYLVESNVSVLRAYDVKNSTVTTLAGMANQIGADDGLGSNARFNGPRHTAQNGTNLLYIADTLGQTIRTYDITSGEVKTIAGSGNCGYANGDALMTKLHAPRGMAFDNQNLYFADDDGHNIRQLQLSTMFMSTLSGLPSDACLNDCSCATNPGGSHVEGGPGSARWNFPYDMVYHEASHSLFVTDGGNDVIRRIR